MREYFKSKWPYSIGGLIILAVILFEAQGKGDFDIFISASRDLLLGNNIYKIQYHEWYHYYYDIFFALVLVPFTYLPLYFAKLFWLFLNVFFVFRIWKIILGWLPLSYLGKSSVTVFKILSLIFILRFLRDNFHLAQVTIFILYLTLEGLFLINSNRRIAGSLLIALGIDIKLLPIVLIPYLIYRNEWKSALYIIGFIIVLLCLPMAIIGFDYNNFLLAERWNLINPMNQAHILDTSERSFHSLTTLLSTLLVKDCGDYYALPLKRNITDISIDKLNAVINVVRMAFILFTLYFLRTKPFTSIRSDFRKLYEISYICIVIPLIFPHQQHYAFFFIFPATTYMLFYIFYKYFDKERRTNIKFFKMKKITFIMLLSIVYFLTNSHFILGEFTTFYDHYKTLTYGVLLLIILLAICKPDKLFPESAINIK